MTDPSLEAALKSRLDQSFGSLAEGLQHLGHDLKTRQTSEIVEDISQYARRNPVSFLAGAAAIGFAAMRLAPSSADLAGEGVEQRSAAPRGRHD